MKRALIVFLVIIPIWLYCQSGIYFNRTLDFMGGQDLCTDIEPHDSGYAIAGFGNATGPGINLLHAYLQVIDSNGHILHSTGYGDTNEVTATSGSNALLKIGDQYIFSGFRYNTIPNGSQWTISKTDDKGNRINYQVGDTAPYKYDFSKQITRLSDKRYVVAGWTTKNDTAWSDARLLWLDTAGQFIQKQVFQTPNWSEDCQSVIQLLSDTIVVGGTTYENGDLDVKLRWLDNSGNVIRVKKFGGNKNDGVPYLYPTADSGFICVSAYTIRYYDPPFPQNPLRKLWVMKFDRVGNLEWDRKYFREQTQTGLGNVRELKDGSFICVGVKGDTLGYPDGILVKISAMGDILWSRQLVFSKSEESRHLI